VPSRSSEPLHAQTGSVGRCVIVSQDDLSLSWTQSVAQYTMKLLERLKATSSTDGFLLRNLTNMHPSAFHNTVHVVLRLRTLFSAFSLAMSYDAFPRSVVLFPDQSDETRFRHPSRCCEESRRLRHHISRNCEGTLFR
jgi:hypothetical protein